MQFLTDYDPKKKRFCSIIPLLMAGGAAASIGGNIFSGIMGAKSSKKQAEDIRRSQQAAQAQGQWAMAHGQQLAFDAEQRGQTNFSNQARDWLGQTHAVGQKATNDLYELISSGGKTMGGRNLADLLQESPLYQFESQLGSRDINRQLKARGMYGSGAGLEALTRFHTELSAKEGERQYSRLAGGLGQLGEMGLRAGSQVMAGQTSLSGQIMGVGGQLAGQTMQLGGNLATQQMNAGMAAAGAEAQGRQQIAQLGSQIGGGLSQTAGNFMQYDMMGPILQSMQQRGQGNGVNQQEALGRGIVQGTQAAMSMYATPQQSGYGLNDMWV